VDEVAQLAAGKRVNQLLDSWHQYLMELFGTSLGEYEGATELFDVFWSEGVDVHNHVLLDVFEKER
tara:strand:+ start:20 stop:217 length:198 start_codon:yes stop_codon:yes gene_type:complete